MSTMIYQGIKSLYNFITQKYSLSDQLLLYQNQMLVQFFFYIYKV